MNLQKEKDDILTQYDFTLGQRPLELILSCACYCDVLEILCFTQQNMPRRTIQEANLNTTVRFVVMQHCLTTVLCGS